MRHLCSCVDSRIGPARDGQLCGFIEAQYGGDPVLDCALDRAQALLVGPTVEVGAVVGDVESKTG